MKPLWLNLVALGLLIGIKLTVLSFLCVYHTLIWQCFCRLFTSSLSPKYKIGDWESNLVHVYYCTVYFMYVSQSLLMMCYGCLREDGLNKLAQVPTKSRKQFTLCNHFTRLPKNKLCESTLWARMKSVPASTSYYSLIYLQLGGGVVP